MFNLLVSYRYKLRRVWWTGPTRDCKRGLFSDCLRFQLHFIRRPTFDAQHSTFAIVGHKLAQSCCRRRRRPRTSFGFFSSWNETRNFFSALRRKKNFEAQHLDFGLRDGRFRKVESNPGRRLLRCDLRTIVPSWPTKWSCQVQLCSSFKFQTEPKHLSN